MVRLGSRVSSPNGAAASNPTKASRQKIIPWNAGRTLPLSGMKTLSVFLEPALATSSADTNTKIAISMIPSTTPVRALSWIPE